VPNTPHPTPPLRRRGAYVRLAVLLAVPPPAVPARRTPRPSSIEAGACQTAHRPPQPEEWAPAARGAKQSRARQAAPGRARTRTRRHRRRRRCWTEIPLGGASSSGPRLSTGRGPPRTRPVRAATLVVDGARGAPVRTALDERRPRAATFSKPATRTAEQSGGVLLACPEHRQTTTAPPSRKEAGVAGRATNGWRPPHGEDEPRDGWRRSAGGGENHGDKWPSVAQRSPFGARHRQGGGPAGGRLASIRDGRDA